MKFKKTWTYCSLFTLLNLSKPPYGRSNKNCKRRLPLPKLSIAYPITIITWPYKCTSMEAVLAT